MKKKRLIFISSLIVLAIIILIFLLVNNSKNELTEEERSHVSNVVNSYVEEYCDNLSKYMYSNISERGWCPNCWIDDKVPFVIEKSQGFYYINISLVTKAAHSYYNIEQFTIDKEGNVVNDSLFEYNCYNPPESVMQCIRLNRNSTDYLYSFKKNTCTSNEDCLFVEPKYLMGYCGDCVSDKSINLNYLSELKEEYFLNECAKEEQICTLNLSCFCSNEHACTLNLSAYF